MIGIRGWQAPMTHFTGPEIFFEQLASYGLSLCARAICNRSRRGGDQAARMEVQGPPPGRGLPPLIRT